MRNKNNPKKHPGYKRWIVVFALIGLIVHGGVFYFFVLDLEDPPERSVRNGFVFFQPEVPVVSDELEQRAYLFDSEPIFLPTNRNFSGPIKTDATVWEPEVDLSAAFAPYIRWNDTLLLKDPGIGKGSETPLDLLNEVSRDFFSEFGAREPIRPEIHIRGMFVEAKNSQGTLILKKFIKLEKAAELEFPQNPVEFSIWHSNFGLAGEPLLINPSGSESTDQFVRKFILEKVHPMMLGMDGYFHVKIGL